jgi:hypothetical protein
MAKQTTTRPTRKPAQAAGADEGLPKFSNTEEFLALSDADKERVWESLNREIPFEETRPLTAAERAQSQRVKRKAGRPKVGNGTRVVSVSVERGLLEQADAYAKRHGLKRAQVFALGLGAVLQGEGARKR